MLPFKYLEIDNHKFISDKIKKLIEEQLYINFNSIGDIEFSFVGKHPYQEKYDILQHTNFWNFLSNESIIKFAPELIMSLNKLNIFPISYNLLISREDFYGVLHSDGGDKNHPYRINWPILNCDDSVKTIFYKLKNSTLIDFDYKSKPFKEKLRQISLETAIYDHNDIEDVIDFYVLSKPVIFNYSIPHNILWPKDKQLNFPRCILAIDFHSNADFLS